MNSVKLAILGAGSVRCSVPVLVSLATYFGERPLEVALYDADAERLELFDLFAQLAFSQNENTHRISSSLDPEVVLAEATRVVIQIDANCALKEARASKAKQFPNESARVTATLERLRNSISGEADVISLLPADVRIPLPYYYRLDWPAEPGEEEARSLPHQVLRWIRGEEYLFEMFARFDRSPLKAWLDDVTTAIVVSEA